MIIVVIASDVSCAPISLWTLLRDLLGAQWTDETINICSRSNYASICRFSGSNLNCWHYDGACLGVRRSCRLPKWVLNAAVCIWSRLNRRYPINSFDLWCNSEYILANWYATHWIGVKLVKSSKPKVSVYWKYDKSVRAHTPMFGLRGIRMGIVVYGCKCGLEW